MDLPQIIPPKSTVQLVRADAKTPMWKTQVGRLFRIGYYSRQDGLECIWLVNASGEYEQATDREGLLRYFEIKKLSRETDCYGESKRPLRPLKKAGADAKRVCAVSSELVREKSVAL